METGTGRRRRSIAGVFPIVDDSVECHSVCQSEFLDECLHVIERIACPDEVHSIFHPVEQRKCPDYDLDSFFEDMLTDE